MKSFIQKIQEAEHILNVWLVDNTLLVFEEEAQIDTARGLLNEVLDELQKGVPKLRLLGPSMADMLNDSLLAWEGEEASVKREHAILIDDLQCLCGQINKIR